MKVYEKTMKIDDQAMKIVEKASNIDGKAMNIVENRWRVLPHHPLAVCQGRGVQLRRFPHRRGAEALPDGLLPLVHAAGVEGLLFLLVPAVLLLRRVAPGRLLRPARRSKSKLFKRILNDKRYFFRPGRLLRPAPALKIDTF